MGAVGRTRVAKGRAKLISYALYLCAAGVTFVLAPSSSAFDMNSSSVTSLGAQSAPSALTAQIGPEAPVVSRAPVAARTPTDAPPAPGTSALLDSARAIRGQTLVVSLITYGPGDEVFERFGHIALAIRDTLTGQDVAYNWGMFDFNQPNFLGRFLTGDTRYWMEGFPTELFNAVYVRNNRSIRIQKLDLTPVERAALLEYVTWNAREENRYYRYDYYRDNCSTRIRDVLNWALQGTLEPPLNIAGMGRTWRGETARITASNLPVYSGIEIALGRDADRSLTLWEEAFLPERLATSLATAVLHDTDGRRYRLARTDTVVFEANRIPIPGEPPSRMLFATLLGLAIAGLIAVLADATGRVSRVSLALFAGVWYFTGGLLGTLLLLAGTITKHAPYMGENTTLLQLHPLLLLAAFTVPLSFAYRTRGRISVGVVVVISLLSLTGLILQFIPALHQSNGVVLAVTIPVHLALAVAVWRLEPRRGMGGAGSYARTVRRSRS